VGAQLVDREVQVTEPELRDVRGVPATVWLWMLEIVSVAGFGLLPCGFCAVTWMFGFCSVNSSMRALKVSVHAPAIP